MASMLASNFAECKKRSYSEIEDDEKPSQLPDTDLEDSDDEEGAPQPHFEDPLRSVSMASIAIVDFS